MSKRSYGGSCVGGREIRSWSWRSGRSIHEVLEKVLVIALELSIDLVVSSNEETPLAGVDTETGE